MSIHRRHGQALAQHLGLCARSGWTFGNESPPAAGHPAPPEATEAVITVPRSPLGQGRSFILKTSTFTAAMAKAGVTVSTFLRYSDGGIYFDAMFLPAGYTGRLKDALYVRPGNVRSALAFKARQHMESVVLPEFMGWVQQVQEGTWEKKLEFYCPRPPEFRD